MIHPALDIRVTQTKTILNCLVLWFMIGFMSYNFTQKYVDCGEIDMTELFEEDGEKEKTGSETNEQDYIYLSFFDYFVGIEEFSPIDTYLYKRYDSYSDISTPPPKLLF